MDQLKIEHSFKVIPPVGWALANIICLATGSENDFVDPGGLNQGLDYAFYVRVVITLAENFLSHLGCGWAERENQDPQVHAETSSGPVGKVLHENETPCALKMSFVDLLRPVCQQWHLTKLLAILKMDAIHGNETLPAKNLKSFGKLDLLDIAYFYSYMLRIFSSLNPTVGSLPLLNMLSFTPGYLVTLWEALGNLLFPGNGNISVDNDVMSKISGKKNGGFVEKKPRQPYKDGGNKWINVLHKITGKSQAGVDNTDSVDGQSSGQVDEDLHDVWDVKLLRCGPQKISRDVSCLLHLFCATYSHLLLVLDDIEFYEKQVNSTWFFPWPFAMV